MSLPVSLPWRFLACVLFVILFGLALASTVTTEAFAGEEEEDTAARPAYPQEPTPVPVEAIATTREQDAGTEREEGSDNTPADTPKRELIYDGRAAARAHEQQQQQPQAMTERASSSASPRGDILVLADPDGGGIGDLGCSFLGDSAILKRASALDVLVLAMEEQQLPQVLAAHGIEHRSEVPGIPEPIAALLSEKALRASFPAIDALVMTFRDDAPPHAMADFLDVDVAMATALVAVGEYEEASAVLGAAYGQAFSRNGTQHRQTQLLLQALVDLYDAWNKPRQADYYRKFLN